MKQSFNYLIDYIFTYLTTFLHLLYKHAYITIFILLLLLIVIIIKNAKYFKRGKINNFILVLLIILNLILYNQSKFWRHKANMRTYDIKFGKYILTGYPSGWFPFRSLRGKKSQIEVIPEIVHEPISKLF